MNVDKLDYNLKTDRDVFNHVRDHLIKQTQQAAYQSGYCVYRMSNGMSCAIGCLISDENYDEDILEDQEADDGEVLNAVRLSNPDWKPSKNYHPMLFFLQKVHDYLTPYTWESDLNYLETILFEEGSDSLREDGVYYERLDFKHGRIIDKEAEEV